MSVPANTVDVNPVGDIPAGDLQTVLGTINGKADWAAGAAGAADAKAVNAQATADNAKGTVDGYVAPLVGKLDAEMAQVFAHLNIPRA